MWRADRNTVRPGATDEDRAMAHTCYGISYYDRDDARNALLRGIMDEIRHFVNGSPTRFNSPCVIRLAKIHGLLMENPERNEADYDGLHFSIKEWGTK